MDRARLERIARRQGIASPAGRVTINVDQDLGPECRFVDFLLANALRRGRCARILRNLMVVYAARISLRNGGRDHLFDPEAVCETLRVLEGHDDVVDAAKGPFRYEKGLLTGLYKKHFFQASFLVDNIFAEMLRSRDGGPQIIHRALARHYGRNNYLGRTVSDDDARLLAEAFTDGVLERRARRRQAGRDGGLTGEHLIYAASSQGNIYLYVSFHGEDLARIADMVRGSLPDFPELNGIAPALSG